MLSPLRIACLVLSGGLFSPFSVFAVDDLALNKETEQAALVKKGQYIFTLAGCKACHTDSKNGGEFLAGGRALETPFGTFYAPNITPSKKHGIGTWNEADFTRALRKGYNPEGGAYYPVFPYAAYTKMRYADMRALWAYLKTVPVIEKENKPHDIVFFANRYGNWFWQTLYFDAGVWEDNWRKSPRWNRGGYIANAMAHCGECHSPRNLLGAIDEDKAYAGTLEGPEGEVAPNITADVDTGIGTWSHDDLVYFFEDGALPNGDYSGGLMAEVIDEGLSKAEKEDLHALAEYIASIPAVNNKIDSGEETEDSEEEEEEEDSPY